MRLGFNGATTMRATLVEDIRAAASAGFSALEVWADKMHHYLKTRSPQDLRSEFAAHGIEPASINSIERIAFRGAEYPQVQEQCRKTCEIAQAIGCDKVVVVPSPRPERAEWPQIREESVRVLRDLSSIAAPYGVNLAFEFLGQPDCSVSTLAQSWEIVRDADASNVGLVIDAFHFYAGGSSLESLSSVRPDKVLVFHINDAEDMPREELTDAQRLLPGEGVIPLRDILARLKGIGFDGLCSIELFRPAYWKRDPEELARDAYNKTADLLRQAGFTIQ